jgi:hypothetical protein
MSFISGKGSEINFNDVDLKAVFIRLKDGESVKVRVLGLTDYIEYKAHSDFNNKVYTQPCIVPTGAVCPFCVASKAGIEEFKGLYAKKRYLFALADLNTGKIRVWDCSYGQAKDLLGQINEYKDDINEVAFNFKRTGAKKDTTYKLNPILKLKGDDIEKFHNFDDVEVEIDFFESCLVPKSEQLIMDVLNDAGFPVIKHFPNFVATADKPAEGTAPAPQTNSNVEPIDDGETPF